MRSTSYLVMSWALLLVICGRTDAQTVAVFDFELIDTSLQGEIRPRNRVLTLHMWGMAERTDDASAGWKVTIRVPQPNGADVYHLWVAAIADERETRERLLLPDLPGEARLEPLSTDELAEFGLESGEVRRIS